MSPVYFAGVTGVAVPLPWDGSVAKGGSATKNGVKLNSSTTRMVPTADAIRRRSASSRRSSSFSKQSASSTSLSSTPDDKETAHRTAPLRRLSSLLSSGSEGKMKESAKELSKAGSTAGAEYSMSRNEVFTYQESFSRHSVTEVHGSEKISDSTHSSQSSTEKHVYVDEAVSLFSRSGLHRTILGKLWDVVVTDPDSGKLDEEEFVLMAHLIVCVTRRKLPVPGELPEPLKAWKKERLKSKDNRQPSSGSSSGSSIQQQREHRRGSAVSNTTFVSMGRKSPSAYADNENNSAAHQAINEQRDEKRIKRMEKQIQSLKRLVGCLTEEIKDLKVLVRKDPPSVGQGFLRGAPGGSDAGAARVQRGGGERRRVAQEAVQQQKVVRPGREGKVNKDIGTSNHSKQSILSSNDDVPNVDLEVYWGQKQVLDDSEKTVSSNSNGIYNGIQKPPHPKPPSLSSAAPTPFPKPVPPSALRKSTHANMRSGGARSSLMRPSPPASFRGMSQNIPMVHPSSGKQKPSSNGPSRRNAPSAHRSRSMPQSHFLEQKAKSHRGLSDMAHMQQGQNKENGSSNKHAQGRTPALRRHSSVSQGTTGSQKNPVPRRAASNTASRRNNSVSRGTAVSQTNSLPSHTSTTGSVAEAAPINAESSSEKQGVENNLISQMKQVKREDKFDTLLHQAMERMGSESASVTSHTSSHHSPTKEFQPAKINTAAVPNRRSQFARSRNTRKGRGMPSRRASLVDSCRHITRRSSGETLAYQPKESMPASTAAVDLPPLL